MTEEEKVITDYENIHDYFPFPTKRYGQDDVLSHLRDYLLNPKVKYILVEAGTGWGKSGFAMTAALASKKAYVATANKFLQGQYERDFDDIIVSLKGRSNYKCNKFEVPSGLKDKIGEFYNCSNSPCQATGKSRSDCFKERCCEYHKQLDKASEADITSFNFASALAFLNYLTKYFPKRNLLVCDECHNIPSWLTNFISVDFTLQNLKELGLEQQIPDFKTVEDYADYLVNVQITVNRFLEDGDKLDPKIVERLETFSRKFILFDKITEDKSDMGNFVFEKIYDGSDRTKIIKIAFKPVAVDRIAHDYLFRHANKVILLSATILDFSTYMKMLGLKREEVAIIRVPSIFPVQNRPITTQYAVGYLNQKNLDASLPNIINAIDMILETNENSNVKGIIHGVTYKICNYIYENLANRKRLLYPKNASEQQDIVQEHLQSKKPTILLSPSMTEGVDLKGDASRVQIFAKMPFAYRGDPVLLRREILYPNYYNMLTALAITQGYGRSIRDMDDKCTTYFLDLCLLSFVRNNPGILHPSFIEAVN